MLVTLMAVLILLLRFSGPLVLSQLSVRQADTPQYSYKERKYTEIKGLARIPKIILLIFCTAIRDFCN